MFTLKYYPKGSCHPTATARVDSSDTSKLATLYQDVNDFFRELSPVAIAAREAGDRLASPIDSLLYGPNTPTPYDKSSVARITYEYGNLRGEQQLFAHETDAIAMVLYACYINDAPAPIGGTPEKRTYKPVVRSYSSFNGLTVSFEYDGDTYENITGVNVIESRLGCCGVRFLVEGKDGEPMIYYLIGKTAFGETEYNGDPVMQSPSFGLIPAGLEIHPKLWYAGNRLCYKKYAEADENAVVGGYEALIFKDADGNLIEGRDELNCEYIPPMRQVASVAHLFFERHGGDFAFYVLSNGELRKKISKTDDAVIFYGTPLNFLNGSADCNADDEDIVFQRVDGDYLCASRYLTDDRSYNLARNAVIDMPAMPASFDADSLSAFYTECEKALYKAFESSEALYTTVYEWDAERRVYEWADDCTEALGSDDPPACQITIESVDECLHSFSYEDAVITVRPSVPFDQAEAFSESYVIPFPSFDVVSVGFEADDGVELMPKNGSLNVRITDAKTGQTFDGSFSLISMHPDFDNTGIPSNLYLDDDWTAVREQLDLYRTIISAIIKFGVRKCEALLDSGNDNPRTAISELLYGDEGMVPDESIISAAVHLKNEFDRTGVIPNIAIVGHAGTGKSTLARKLGRLFGKDVLALTPSDLRGAYIGHTKHEVVQRLAEAAANNQIVFVDEAYQLMQDSHGREAVTVLLPLMTGDQTRVESNLDRGQRDSLILDFKKGFLKTVSPDGVEKKTTHFTPGVVPIWLSGYENEVRSMISRNQGLYRRLKKLVIKTPTTTELLTQFDNELEAFANGNDKVARKAAMLKKHFSDNKNRETVKKFFAWGSQPQNSKCFASHAGVSSFVANCIDRIDFGADIGAQVLDIIAATKLDIKRQLSVIRADNESSPSHAAADTINVITDIDTHFSDLVGCDSQMAYMQNVVISMLVQKSVYDDRNLTVPKGCLMEGLPGTGKSYIARAFAGELQARFEREAPDKRVGFISISGSELAGKPVSYIASVFSAAEEFDSCVLFIDEVDAIAKRREYNPFYDRFLELLRQMDGTEKRSNIFILAATNAPETLDPAFVRSGRIDTNLVFTLPNKDDRIELARRAILKRIRTLTNFDPVGKDEDIASVAEFIAKRMRGCTAGDIENIVNASFIAYHQFTHRDESGGLSEDFFTTYPFVKRNRSGRLYADTLKLRGVARDKSLRALLAFICEEIERFSVGTPDRNAKETKFSVDKNDNNSSSTAIHEVGHAVVSLMLGEKPFDTITILPRGDYLGYVSNSETHIITKADYLNKIRVCMGGRIAEELIYGKDNISVGASNDIRQATSLAHRMIERFGFSDEFGFVALTAPNGKYLGNADSYMCSDAFREKADEAVNELLKKLYTETLDMLTDKKELIVTLAKRVFDAESMTGEQFRRLYEAELKKLNGNA